MKIESLEAIPGLAYWKDQDSIVRGCNQHFASSIGFASPEEVVGCSLEDIAWNNNNAERILNSDKAVLTNQSDHKEEELLRHINGDVVRLATSKQPLRNDDDQIIGILCVCQNVSYARKRLMEADLAKEKAESANQAKSAFLACMSHDLRTPL